MVLNNLTRLKDHRTDCYSIIFEMTLEDYLGLVAEIYKDKGGIREQREPLKSSSAMRIRRQMVKDIRAGTILPPIVLGLIISPADFERIPEMTSEQLTGAISGADAGYLTIIDGMQRTTALSESRAEGANPETIVRVEFWISTRLNSLIYRMLVLNTGQVPWNLRRQVETVFSSMINEMIQFIPEMEVYTIDEANRRTRGGQYHADALVELYLAFGGRKEKVDTKERLADEFTRLDFIEATENSNFADTFYGALQIMVLVDIEFSKHVGGDPTQRFNNGKDLFGSQPARVGFMTAFARQIYGRPGFERDAQDASEIYEQLRINMREFITKVNAMNSEALEAFLALDTLTEKLSKKSARVGDFEREYFVKAFETLFEEGSNIPSMQICWVAF